MIKSNILRVALGAVLCWIPVQAQAQEAPLSVAPSADEAFAVKPVPPVAPRPFVPELPPIQPMLPEVQDMRLVLRLGERRVYVYRGDEVQSSYPVAIGKPGWETPTGQHEVMTMLENPGWTSPFTGEVMAPGPDNPLGERWIAFWTDGTNYIGFHGTPNRESVGQAASHGCVRMYNEDIREMFSMVEMGTPVIVER